MNTNYFPNLGLARRATLPISPLAPTASMIDPNLEQFNGMSTMQHQRMSRTPGSMSMPSQMQNQMQSPMQTNSSHLQSPMQSSNTRQQLQSPIQSNSHFQNAAGGGGGGGHVRPGQSITPERNLPPSQVNNHTIDDAYVQFILFCNPSIPMDTDTAELKRGFRAPPKSDGKTFSPYDLFTLIAKLEDKKDGIDNWTKLVLELGVEPPDQEKGQSSQKVQQYAVRLKRWLRSFHVDAFYGHLLGRPTTYQIDRPPATAGIGHASRDGILPEDDLAIRALVPSYRPKRGRRKQEDIDAGAEVEASSKRQNTRSSSADFPSLFEDQNSTAPGSAITWSAPTSNDMWAAAQLAIAPKSPNPSQTPPTTTSQIGPESAPRTTPQTPWRFNATDTPTGSYPQSAVTPRQSYSASPAFDEPRSAHPASSSKSPNRTKRRQAPAVSSAWPSSASGGSGKLRGRPPSNRSVQDGPFSTFPANPTNKEVPTVTVATSTNETNPENSTSEAQPNIQRDTSPSSAPGTLSTQSTVRKPSKLQLQVPAHSGGPVRLATPPQVLINGESSQPTIGRLERGSSAEYFNQLDEISEDDEGSRGEDEETGSKEDWKRRALVLKKKLAEKEEELRAVKRRVLDAVM